METFSRTWDPHRVATVVTIGVLAVLGAATVYHLLLVVDAVEYGSRGRQPAGAFLVQWSVVAMAVAVAQMIASLVGEGTDRRLIALVPLAASAVVISRYYSPDQYYLHGPHPLNIAEGGTIAASLVWATLGVSAAASVTNLRWPRIGVLLGVAALALSATTVASEGFGH
jgi:hypothetical protein